VAQQFGVELTIATALTEEMLFRGVLQALFRRSLGTSSALIATNIVFALWHLAINALTLSQNAVALPFIPSAWAQVLGYLGSLIAVGIGGFILSILRERTNHLAASIVAHWVSVGAITVLVYAT
jgi:membrane protease YdiL (CAAX protease family)